MLSNMRRLQEKLGKLHEVIVGGAFSVVAAVQVGIAKEQEEVTEGAAKGFCLAARKKRSSKCS